MAAAEQPYDPYIPSGSNGAAGNGQNGNQRTAALQAVSASPYLCSLAISATEEMDQCFWLS